MTDRFHHLVDVRVFAVDGGTGTERRSCHLATPDDESAAPWRELDRELRIRDRSPISRLAMRSSAGRPAAQILGEETCGRSFWLFCSQSAFQISMVPAPPMNAAPVAIRHRRAHASSMAGAAARLYGTSALLAPGLVRRAAKVMRGAVATRPVSSAEGRDRNRFADQLFGCRSRSR